MKACFVIWALCLPLLVQAQSYSINWFTIDSGGGASTGGVYAVSGTVGQPDAGAMSGGNYSVSGGFWGVVAAVQTPGAPLLRIAVTSTNTVIVAWPAPSTGFTLQQNSSLATTNWVALTNTPVLAGDERQVVLPSWPGSRFFRLKAP